MLKGVLGADFTAFVTAVNNTETVLKRFEGDANKVASALNKMGDSFSGRQVISQAQLAMKAVQDIGGASMLTADEQKRLNTMLDQAIQKYAALGQTAPQAMLDLKKQTEDTSTVAKKLGEDFNVAETIEHPLQAAANALKSFATAIGPVGLAVAATAGVLFELTKEAAAVGATLNDMSQKTGISVPMLSRLSQAAQVAGTDINALSDAIYKMDIQAADSPEKFAKGMERLGLNTKDFLALSPDERLLAFSKALNATADASERNAAGAEVMGRQFKDLGPALMKLNEGLALTAEMSVWSEQQAAEAEQFEMQMKALKLELVSLGIAIGRDLLPAALALLQWFKDLKPAIADFVAATPPGMIFKVLKEEVGYASAALSLFTKDFGKLPPVVAETGHVMTTVERQAQSFWKAMTVPANTGKDFTDLNAMWRDQTKALLGTTKVTKEHEAAIIGLGEGEKTLEGVLKLQQEQLQRYYARLEQIIPATRDWNGLLALTPGEIIETTNAMIDWNQVGAKVATETLPGIVEGTGIAKSGFQQFADSMTASLGGLNDIFQRAFEGGGGVLGAIKSFGTNVASSLLGLIPIVGPILSQFGGAIVAGLSKIFGNFGGPSKDETAARDTFAKQFTSVKDAIEKVGTAYAKMGKTGTEAQQDLQRALDATHKSAAAEAEALKVINDKIAGGKTAMDALTAAVGRYKFSTQELGSALARQKLDEQAKQLLSDWQLLTGAGINIAAIGREMAASINAFQQDAVASGQEVDVALKPMLEKMREMGLLTDAAGNKVEDFDAAGIHFSMTMSEGFKTVVDAVKEMTAAIKQALGIVDATANAVDKLGDAANNIPQNPFQNWNMPKVGLSDAVPSFGGGGVVLPFPGGRTSGLATVHTGEMILTPQQQQTLVTGSGGGAIEITVVSQLDGRTVARSVTRVQSRDLQTRRKLGAA